MKTTFEIQAIGQVVRNDEITAIELDRKYIPGLEKIEGFSHLQVLWWGHLTDQPEDRERLIADNLFKKAPDKVGIFSTRAPARPNPILLSTIKVVKIDAQKGIIYTPFIDAEEGSPVLDIKPYFPMERIKHCKVPEWFAHWPEWAEDALDFDWKKEINFPQDPDQITPRK
jgi:tRNA-Thr(GGU) m(6)t(6)A37 methyltransferase TsaA